MKTQTDENGTPEAEPEENSRFLWLLVLTPVILSGALTIVAFILGPTFDPALLLADGPMMASPYAYHERDETVSEDSARCIQLSEEAVLLSGPNAPEALESESVGAKDRDCTIGVWTASLHVGEANSEGAAILGYEPGRAPSIGELDDVGFTYWREDYAVNGPASNSKANSNANADANDSSMLTLDKYGELPTGLVLRVGPEQFPLPNVTYFAENGDNVWQPDSQVGWKEGQSVRAPLLYSPWLRSGTGQIW